MASVPLSITLSVQGGLQKALAEFNKLSQAEKDLAIAAQNSAHSQIQSAAKTAAYLKSLPPERAAQHKAGLKEIEQATKESDSRIAASTKARAAESISLDKTTNKEKLAIEKEFQKGRLLYLKEYQVEAAAIAKQAAERQDGLLPAGSGGLPGIGQAALLGLAIRQSADLVKDLVDVAAKYEVLGKRIEFVAGSSAKAAYEQEKLQELANKYGFEQDKLIDGYATLATRLREVGLSSSQLDTFFENLTISGKAQSISSEAYNLSLVQLSQGLSTGALRGQEYNSVTEAGIITTGSFAKALGVSAGEVKGLAEQGKLTTDVVLKAAQITREEFGGAAEAASKTAVSSFARMGNALDNLKVAIGKFTLTPVAEGVDAAAKSIKVFSDTVDAFANNSSGTQKDLPWWAIFLPGGIGATAGVLDSQKDASDALTEQAVGAARNISASLQEELDKTSVAPRIKLTDLEKTYGAQTDAAKSALADQQTNLQEALNDQRLSQSDYQAYILQLGQEASRKQIDILEKQAAAFKSASLASGITEEERTKKIADTELKIKEIRLKSAQETYSEVERLARESQQRIADQQTDARGTNSNRASVLNSELNLIKQGQSLTEKQIQNEIVLAQMRGESGHVEELKLKLFDEQTRSLLEQTKIQSEINRLNIELARIQNEITISNNNAEIAKRIARDGANADIKALVEQQTLLQETIRNLGKISELNGKNAKNAEQELILGRLKSAQTREQYQDVLNQYEQTLRGQKLNEDAIRAALAAIEEMARAQEQVADSAKRTAAGYSGAADQAGRLADNLDRAASAPRAPGGTDIPSDGLKSPIELEREADEARRRAEEAASNLRYSGNKYEGRSTGLSDQKADDAAAKAKQDYSDRYSDALGRYNADALERGDPILSYGDRVPAAPAPIPNTANGVIQRATPGGAIRRIAEAGDDEAVIPLNNQGAKFMAASMGLFQATQPSVTVNQEQVVAKLDSLQQALLKIAANGQPITIYGSDNPAMDASTIQASQLTSALRGAGL